MLSGYKKGRRGKRNERTERVQQLQFEKEQYEQKLRFEQKSEEIKKDKAATKSNTDQMRTKLPKFFIIPFNGAPTDWLRFWNVLTPMCKTSWHYRLLVVHNRGR